MISPYIPDYVIHHSENTVNSQFLISKLEYNGDEVKTMYKMIAIDIDDTLLNDELTVTTGTKAAMKAAMELGVIVTLATGRMYASAKKIANQIGLNVPLITYHGSLVKNLVDEKIVYERSVPTLDAQRIYQFCKEHNLHLQLYINDQVYAEEENEKIIGYGQLTGLDYYIEPDFTKLLDLPSQKMLILEDADRIEPLTRQLRQIVSDEVHLTRSKPTYLEITHAEGKKSDAIIHLARHFGCDLSEVITIGDSWNDREMIEVAGLGVAMGNASPAIKELADYVTKSNNEEGVRHVIEKFILQRNE